MHNYPSAISGMWDKRGKELDIFFKFYNEYVVPNENIFDCQAHTVAAIVAGIALLIPGLDDACCSALKERAMRELKLAEYHCFFAVFPEPKELTPCPF